MKIIWKVEPAPTGRYRSFNRRGWPMAHYPMPGDPPAAMVSCADEYDPKKVRTGDHLPLSLHIAYWEDPATRGGRAAFSWRKVVGSFNTLAEAKAQAARILDDFPQFIGFIEAYHKGDQR